MRTSRLEEALVWATRLHAGQTRKSRPIPYVSHLLAVAALVAEGGGDEDQIVAALLHDAVEDAGGARTRDEIARRFGEPVARIVDACTDSDVTPKPPWRPRKEAWLARLRTAPAHCRLVAVADKLHNARCLEADLRTEGEGAWSRFRGGRDGTLWYYGAILGELRDGWSHPFVDELERTLARIKELAG